MGKETRLFKSRDQKSRTDVSTFLHQFAHKIAQGNVTLSQGADDLMLQLPDNVVLEVQVEDEEKKTRGVQHSLEIEIKWFDNLQAGILELK